MSKSILDTKLFQVCADCMETCGKYVRCFNCNADYTAEIRAEADVEVAAVKLAKAKILNFVCACGDDNNNVECD